MKIYMLIATVLFVILPHQVDALILESTTVTSITTGGARAEERQNIITGSSRSSSEIYTYLSGGSASGTSVTRITTEQNGVRNTETRVRGLAPEEAASLYVATSSRASFVGASTTIREAAKAIRNAIVKDLAPVPPVVAILQATSTPKRSFGGLFSLPRVANFVETFMRGWWPW